MSTALLDPRMFRAYDIRGKAHEQLTEEACLLIGHAFGSILRERTGKAHPRVCVGRDARTHGPLFEQAVTEGLFKAGCTVLHIGPTPSPVNYFTVCTQGLDGGVQVTASHNPADDNGLKLVVADAHPFCGDDIQLLRKRIEEGTFFTGKGYEEDMEDARTAYINHVSTLFPHSPLHIGVDYGNSVCGPTYGAALTNTGCTLHELYAEPDGTFPNHPADPIQWDTLRELQDLVQKNSLHFGIAFDGDGDRLGVIDDQGRIVTADQTLLLLAHDHLQRHPGTSVVFTVSNSSALDTEISRWGGTPIMSKVGHSFVEHAMHQHGALLGGEQSGHFFCGEEYFPYDDALVAALHILHILHQRKQPLSELLAAFPKMYQAQEQRPHCPDEEKTKIIEKVKKHFLEKYPVNTLDGIRIDFGDGAWAGIRQSNTSPRISICAEARSPEKLQQIEDTVLSHLKTYDSISWS